MSLRTRLRIRFKRAEWQSHDRLFNHADHRRPPVQRYVAVPASRRRGSRKTSQAVMDGQTILLLAFLLLVVVVTLASGPSARFVLR